MSNRRGLAILWSIGAFAVTSWWWMTYSGLFRLAAEWQLGHFGEYEVTRTLFGSLIVMLLPAGFIGGWGPPGRPAPRDQVARAAAVRRNARIMALAGVAALVIGATGGAVGYQKMRTPRTSATLVLTTGAEPLPAADLMTLNAVARPDLIVRYSETVAGSKSEWSFVPLVASNWKPGEPIRFILRTNQTAWLPPAGTPGSFAPRMLLPGSAPFRMTTEPSVLKQHVLPGVVGGEYEKARIALDPAVVVVEQSTGELYTPYWMIAAGGGLVGMCLLFAALIGTANVKKPATA